MLRHLELVAMMLDRDARVTYCNDFLLRLTGWRIEEVMGRDWFNLFLPPELGGEVRGFTRDCSLTSRSPGTTRTRS